jgi:hypothetical protein
MENRRIKILLLILAAVILAGFIWPWIYTYQKMASARQVVAEASTTVVRDPDKIKGLKDRFPLECSVDDAVYIRSYDGYPYWTILICSADGTQRGNFHIGSLWW